MRTMILTALAATAAFTAPSLVAAQNYGYAPPTQGCQQSVNNNRLAGGVVGALAGAALGKQVSGRNARSEGQVLGAVIGAVAGSEIGRRRVACDDYAYRGTQPAPRQGAYQQNGYGYSNYDNRGNDNGYQDRAYQASYRPPEPQRQQCGWGESSIRQPDGRFMTQNVWMCQASNGQWYPANR
jgi:Glycine zipper 2TM domain